jgi:hypothetical protein
MIKSNVWNSGYAGNEHADTSYRNLEVESFRWTIACTFAVGLLRIRAERTGVSAADYSVAECYSLSISLSARELP